ncbi:MAG: HAD family phosphatase [Calditrichaeota bacterium]|nr:HAD family phosphatase [Calditrichota bacterium]
MRNKNDKILTNIQASEFISQLGEEFVAIENPNYIFADFDICPLALKITEPRKKIVAVVQDMDGTTTTTEPLCLHSLEHMVRCFTGQMRREEWKGLDREKDYPHIIGNSTTKHVEYLIRAYNKKQDSYFFRSAYLRSSLLTLAFGRDEGRKREALASLRYFGLGDLIFDQRIKQWFEDAKKSPKIFFPKELEKNFQKRAEEIAIRSFTDQVRAAIEVYYQRYHEILFKIEKNDTENLTALIPAGHKSFIEPMPGVGIFLAAIKGWLGEELAQFLAGLAESLAKNQLVDVREVDVKRLPAVLSAIGKYFQRNPVKVAVVTSSIFYEADIVLSQVFKVMKNEVQRWPVSDANKEMISEKFESYAAVFDEVITASDSSEIRLKPHRDLYSLALHRLGIDKRDYDNVIGFEDSESGTIAIRTAGIGLCVAVPFADTQGHELSYASHILHGGLPEAMLVHHFFLDKNTIFKLT